MLEMLSGFMNEFLAPMYKIYSQAVLFCFICEINLKSGLLCIEFEGFLMRMFKSSTDFIYLVFSEYSGFLLPNKDEVGVKLDYSPDNKGDKFPASAVGWEVLFVMR
jgi:hypothetical protein